LGTGGTSAGRPLLWGLITCLIAAVTAFVGYSVAGTGGGDMPGAAAQPRPLAAPALLRLDRVYAAGRAEGYLAAQDSAFVRGRREGIAEGKRAARRAAARKRAKQRLPFPGRGWYVVGIGADGKTPATPPTPLARGRSYRLCKGGAALCAQQDSKRRPD
jgi:hypothetical protein